MGKVPMSEYQNLAVKLRLLRAEYRFSQAALAARAGEPFSQQYLSHLERGRWPYRPEHVDQLAVALGITKSALLRKVRRHLPKTAQHDPVVPNEPV